MNVGFMESKWRMADDCLKAASELFFAMPTGIVIKPLPSAHIDDARLESGSNQKTRDAVAAVALCVLCARRTKHVKWKIDSSSRDSCCRRAHFYFSFLVRLI